MSEVSRALGELLHALRREGLAISTAQSIEAARAAVLVGIGDRERLRLALRATLVDRRADAAAFDAGFEEAFRGEHAHAGDLFARLRARGFVEAEIEALRELLDALAGAVAGTSGAAALGALRGGDADLEALLRAARLAGVVDRIGARAQVGYFAHQLIAASGIARLADPLGRVEAALAETLGAERAAELGAALREEVERAKRRVRAHVVRAAERAELTATTAAELARLPEGETAGVRRALSILAQKLRGAERVRRRRARRGKIDARRTLRASLRSLGVPLRLLRRRRRPDRAKLVVLCDVSESVRRALGLLLEFVSMAQSLFSRTRSFVFVSDVAETTRLFEDGPERALRAIFSGRVVRTTENSSYGRVLEAFRARYGRELDRRTTLVVLGDGRTNFQGDGAAALRDLRARVGTLLWVTPDARSTWGAGDSAMPAYAAIATQVMVARDARELEAAARAIAKRR